MFFLIFQEYYENSKGQMRRKTIRTCRDVQKNVQWDGKINEHNCIAEGAIQTTMCVWGM